MERGEERRERGGEEGRGNEREGNKRRGMKGEREEKRRVTSANR